MSDLPTEAEAVMADLWADLALLTDHDREGLALLRESVRRGGRRAFTNALDRCLRLSVLAARARLEAEADVLDALDPEPPLPLAEVDGWWSPSTETTEPDVLDVVDNPPPDDPA
jgi:hypothetical protein